MSGETSGLLSRQGGFASFEGSNPSLSAIVDAQENPGRFRRLGAL